MRQGLGEREGEGWRVGKRGIIPRATFESRDGNEKPIAGEGSAGPNAEPRAISD